MLPPRIVRRLIFAPLVIVLALTLIVTLPVWLLAFVASRRRRRLLVFAVAWLTLESAALTACLALWVASGFGGRLRTDRFMDRHYTLIRWFLSRVYGVAVRIFKLRVEIDEPPPTEEELSRRLTRPVVVLARHAGPGDSFLLVYHLLARYMRRPRIVMKAALQYDPSLDVVINRLPNAFVPRVVAESGVIKEIERLANGMAALDALVIFPEGGNFTPLRRQRAIASLEEKSMAEEADRARGMENLLPPRPGGAIAAIDSCPEADVVFVAHTGLDELITIGDVWRRLPMDVVIKARWWRVLAPDVPRTKDEQVRWLYDHWERIDGWIAENRPLAPTR